MRIYTWNMEHGADRWTYLNQHTDADALCLRATVQTGNTSDHWPVKLEGP